MRLALFSEVAVQPASQQRPTWLDLAHRKLDAAVFAAYGWPPNLSAEEILERLLALNLERVGGVNA